MIKKYNTDKNTDTRSENQSPRLSWSALMMGAGVLASVILNYAAYDTRITVLERTRITDERIITNLNKTVDTMKNRMHTMELKLSDIDNDVVNNEEFLERIERNDDKLDKRITELEKKKGK